MFIVRSSLLNIPKFREQFLEMSSADFLTPLTLYIGSQIIFMASFSANI